MVNVKTNVIHVDSSHTAEEGAHSPSWPNVLIIIIITRIECRMFSLQVSGCKATGEAILKSL
jgi:hypothetical protein